MESKKNILISLIIFLIVFLDFITKKFFTERVLILIPGFLEINYTRNYGVIYGFFSNNFIVSIIVPLILLGLVVYYFFIKKEYRQYYIEVSMIIAGIIGNLISRIMDGYVTDFIFIPILMPVFPNFNIADMSVFFGVLSVFIKLLKRK